METFNALAAARRQPAPDDATRRAGLERFSALFADFRPDRIRELAPSIYAPELYFNDSLKTLHEREALVHYLAESAAATEQCRVEVHEQTPIGEGEMLVRWSMMIRFARFRRGQDTWSIGISHLRFDADGRVNYHQDYWNAAEGLFRHLPVIGPVIGWIQRRL